MILFQVTKKSVEIYKINWKGRLMYFGFKNICLYKRDKIKFFRLVFRILRDDVRGACMTVALWQSVSKEKYVIVTNSGNFKMLIFLNNEQNLSTFFLLYNIENQHFKTCKIFRFISKWNIHSAPVHWSIDSLL